MNYYAAKQMKDWCHDNLSPLAWQRIVLKALPDIDSELNYDSLEDPAEDLILSESVMIALNRAAGNIYNRHFPLMEKVKSSGGSGL